MSKKTDNRQNISLLDKNTLGVNIFYLRSVSGFSQRKLGALAGGITHQMIAKYEKGKSLPPLDKLYKLADIFKVDSGDLISKDLRDPNYSPEKAIEDESIEYRRTDPLIEALGQSQRRFKKLAKQLKDKDEKLYAELGLGDEFEEIEE